MRAREFLLEQADVQPVALVVKSSESRPGVFRLINRVTRQIIGEVDSVADIARLTDPRRLPGTAIVFLVSPALHRQYPDIVSSMMRFAPAMAKTQRRPVEVRMMDRAA